MTAAASISSHPFQEINQSVNLNPEDLKGNVVGESEDNQTVIV